MLSSSFFTQQMALSLTISLMSALATATTPLPKLKGTKSTTPVVFSSDQEQDPQLLDEIKRSVVRIGAAACTGMYVSGDGKLATAAHCISHCFNWTPESGHKKTCKIKINEKEYDVNIVAGPRCSTKDIYFSNKMRGLAIQNKKKLEEKTNGSLDCSKEPDLAVIDLPDLFRSTSGKCFDLGAEPKIGDQVFAVGYPDWRRVSEKQDGWNYSRHRQSFNDKTYFDAGDSDQRSWSFGKVVQKDSCTLIGKNSNKEVPFDYKSYGSDSDLHILSLRERTIQSDVDIAKGNSGGPLIDTSGRLVGIQTAFAGGDTQWSECRGRTFSSKMSELEKLTTVDGKPFNLKSLKCDNDHQINPHPIKNIPASRFEGEK